jgi:anaerobic magnesium-protoporphyrin IX monomethyl ester cyclase
MEVGINSIGIKPVDKTAIIRKPLKKILLIYPPFALETAKDRKESYEVAILPPLGMLTLAGEIEKHGYEVSFIDAELEMISESEIIKRTIDIKPDVVGMYCTTSNSEYLIKLSQKIKDIIGSKIFFGGPHAWHHWKSIVNSGVVDYTVVGEGEETCIELLHALNNNTDIAGIKGLAYLDGNEAKFNGERPFVKDLNVLAYCAFHLVDISKYKPSPQHVKRTPSITMNTTRGCPFNCTFCYVPFLFKGTYRTRSVDHVLGEIKQLIRKYGIKEIQFWDDLFGANKKWLGEFADRIIEEKIDITWSCLTRIDTLGDQEMVRKMKKAGCWCIFFGMESLDQEVLDAIDKKLKVEQIVSAIKILKIEGIEIRANFILGSPTETPKKVRKMIKELCELNPDYVKFNVMTPYPGTKIFNEVKEGKWGELIEGYSEDKLTNHEVVFIPSGYKNAEEILNMRKYAFRKFYFRPKYVLSRIQKIKTWFDVVRHYRGLKLVLKRYVF